MSRSGFPDNVLTLEGVTYLLEAKRHGEFLRGDQAQELLEHARAGGIGGMLSIDKPHKNFILIFIEHDADKDWDYMIPTVFPVDFTLDDFRRAVQRHPRVRSFYDRCRT